MARILDRIDHPQDLHDLPEDRARAGRPGGPRAHHRHGRPDRRALRAPTSAPASWPWRCTRCWTRRRTRSCGTSAIRPTRTRSSPAAATSCPTIRQYEGLAPFCSIEESEHDIIGAGHASTAIGYAVGLKEGMPSAATPTRARSWPSWRRRDDRRRRLRGDPPGRRPRHADRRRPQRQRHVDRAQRRRAVALLQPRAPEPQAVARARGRRAQAHRAARRHRRGASSASGRS